nr:hypothetical protein [Vibrio splendidus]MCC4882336.1 hypothetical protein [Vibrio splendidus]
MNQSDHFESSLSANLSTPESKLNNIRLTVLNHCVKAGFISEEEMKDETPRFIWIKEVIHKNIMSLSLLQQLIVDVYEPAETLGEVDSEVGVQAELIIKDIAQRILASSPAFIDKDGSSTRSRLDMK